MKKLLFIVTVVLFVAGFAPRASADVVCYYYYDTTAFNLPGNMTFCALSGAVCWNCGNTNTGVSCASNWNTCDPDQMKAPIFMLLARSEAVGGGSKSDVAGRQSPRERALHLDPAHLL